MRKIYDFLSLFGEEETDAEKIARIEQALQEKDNEIAQLKKDKEGLFPLSPNTTLPDDSQISTSCFGGTGRHRAPRVDCHLAFLSALHNYLA